MGRPRRLTCRICGEPDKVTGELSARGKCSACAEKRMRTNGEALRTMTGPPVLHWRRKHAAAVGAILLDDLPPPLARAAVDYLTSAAQEPNVTAA